MNLSRVTLFSFSLPCGLDFLLLRGPQFALTESLIGHCPWGRYHCRQFYRVEVPAGRTQGPSSVITRIIELLAGSNHRCRHHQDVLKGVLESATEPPRKPP